MLDVDISMKYTTILMIAEDILRKHHSRPCCVGSILECIGCSSSYVIDVRSLQEFMRMVLPKDLKYKISRF